MTRVVSTPTSHPVPVRERGDQEQQRSDSITKKTIAYARPFCDFLTANPTVFHAVAHFAHKLHAAGYTRLSERDTWDLRAGGKYYLTRNASSMIAFKVGADYKPGRGIAMIAGHVDNLAARLKPVSNADNRAGYLELGVAPYAGGMGKTWWDRDLGLAGRVIVKTKEGRIVERLVDIKEPIARIPTLAEHFGQAAAGPFNPETQMVPIIGLTSDEEKEENEISASTALPSFISRQPKRLVRAVALHLGIEDHESIINWELDLYDIQPATIGGLDKEFIFGGRIDDKLCSWAAIEALLESEEGAGSESIKLVGLFDDEEIGSLLRQGARGNLLPGTVERIVEGFTHAGSPPLGQTYANSFLVSADVIHAVNPNFTSAYLPRHMPSLNVGVCVSADPNGHMTTDAMSMSFLQRIADKSSSKASHPWHVRHTFSLTLKCNNQIQVFQIRNDSRSGGTVGPMLSSAMGVRSVDAGCPQLSMHSIRATTGSLDPGLGVQLFRGFFNHFEEVDEEFRND